MASRAVGGNGGQEEDWGCRAQAPCLSALFLEDKVGVLWGAGESCLRLQSLQGTSLCPHIIGHLGQRRAYVEQTIKNSSWDPRERGYCRDRFLESQTSPPTLPAVTSP